MTKWHIRNRVKNAARHFVAKQRSQIRVAKRHVQLALQNRNRLQAPQIKWRVVPTPYWYRQSE